VLIGTLGAFAGRRVVLRLGFNYTDALTARQQLYSGRRTKYKQKTLDK